MLVNKAKEGGHVRIDISGDMKPFPLKIIEIKAKKKIRCTFFLLYRSSNIVIINLVFLAYPYAHAKLNINTYKNG